jgi:hypothetical protein
VDGTIGAQNSDRTIPRGFVAEIRVAPQRRNRAVVWIILLVVIVAALAWYFLGRA